MSVLCSVTDLSAHFHPLLISPLPGAKRRSGRSRSLTHTYARASPPWHQLPGVILNSLSMFAPTALGISIEDLQLVTSTNITFVNCHMSTFSGLSPTIRLPVTTLDFFPQIREVCWPPFAFPKIERTGCDGELNCVKDQVASCRSVPMLRVRGCAWGRREGGVWNGVGGVVGKQLTLYSGVDPGYGTTAGTESNNDPLAAQSSRTFEIRCTFSNLLPCSLGDLV